MPAPTKPNRKTSPIADRVRAYADEQDEGKGISLRELSRRIGWHETQLGVVLRRLDEGGDIELESLKEIAHGMNRPLTWLVSGEEPQGVKIADMPQWPAEAAIARDRYRVSAEALEEIGRWRVEKVMGELDARLIAALARALEDARADRT